MGVFAFFSLSFGRGGGGGAVITRFQVSSSSRLESTPVSLRLEQRGLHVAERRRELRGLGFRA